MINIAISVGADCIIMRNANRPWRRVKHSVQLFNNFSQSGQLKRRSNPKMLSLISHLILGHRHFVFIVITVTMNGFGVVLLTLCKTMICSIKTFGRKFSSDISGSNPQTSLIANSETRHNPKQRLFNVNGTHENKNVSIKAQKCSTMERYLKMSSAVLRSQCVQRDGLKTVFINSCFYFCFQLELIRKYFPYKSMKIVVLLSII